MTNRFIVLATPVLGLLIGLGALVRGESLGDSAWWGFYGAGAGFLAWAVAVELHPDRPWLAAMATVLAPIGLVWDSAALLVSAAVLLAVRAAAGTTGRSLRFADLVLLVVVAGPTVSSDAAPAALAAGALGLGLSAVWHHHRRGLHVVATCLYLLAAGVSLVLSDDLGLPAQEALWAVGAGAVVGLVTLVGPGRVAATTDRTGGEVLAVRVRLARFVTLLAAIGVSLTVHPATVAPLWAALIAIAVSPR